MGGGSSSSASDTQDNRVGAEGENIIQVGQGASYSVIDEFPEQVGEAVLTVVDGLTSITEQAVATVGDVAAQSQSTIEAIARAASQTNADIATATTQSSAETTSRVVAASTGVVADDFKQLLTIAGVAVGGMFLISQLLKG